MTVPSTYLVLRRLEPRSRREAWDRGTVCSSWATGGDSTRLPVKVYREALGCSHRTSPCTTGLCLFHPKAAWPSRSGVSNEQRPMLRWEPHTGVVRCNSGRLLGGHMALTLHVCVELQLQPKICCFSQCRLGTAALSVSVWMRVSVHAGACQPTW